MKTSDHLREAQLLIAKAVYHGITDLEPQDEKEIRHMLNVLPHIIGRLEGVPVNMAGEVKPVLTA